MRFSTSAIVRNDLLQLIADQTEGIFRKRFDDIDADSFVTVLAPHGTTLRLTYTVPAGKEFLIVDLHHSVERITAPTVIGNSMQWFEIVRSGIGTNQILRANAVLAVVGSNSYSRLANSVLLVAGDVLNIQTLDLSVGGTVAFEGSYSGFIFDV